MKKKKQQGIRKKATMGFVFIALILFFSGTISVFELVRMNNYVTARIADNVRSVDLSRELYMVQSEYNNRLLLTMGDDSLSAPDLTYDDTFIDYLDQIRNSGLEEKQKSLADSVLYAYAAYMQVSREAENVWPQGVQVRKEWYFDRLNPVFEKQNNYIERLSDATQEALAENSSSMEAAFYRSIMPSLISVIAGIILVFLFDLFFRYYFINPVLRINKGIRDFKKVHKPYSVKIDSADEIAELSSGVEELVNSSKDRR